MKIKDGRERWKPFSQVRSLLQRRGKDERISPESHTASRNLLTSSCSENFYYDGSQCVACPAHSSAPAGSTNSSDCACNAGYVESGQACSACPFGTYRSATDPSCMPCSSCPSGYYSNCTAVADGGCLPCRNAPARAIYTSSGMNSTIDVTGDWLAVPVLLPAKDLVTSVPMSLPADFSGKLFNVEGELVNVTAVLANSFVARRGALYTIVRDHAAESQLTSAWSSTYSCFLVEEGVVFILNETCHVTMHLPDSCSFVCNTSTRMNGMGECVDCTTASCAIGQYRAACNETDDGICTSCTNSKPENTEYSSPGIPYDSNACQWTCVSGFYKDGSQCSSCTNALPNNAYYSGPGGPGDGCSVCPWTCNDGYVRVDSSCVLRGTVQASECLGGDVNGACGNGAGLPSAPRMEFGQNNSIVMVTTCQAWEYSSCSAAGLSCHVCSDVQEVNQSGWTYHWMSSCPVGQFRSPCSSACVQEYRSTYPGQCLPCTNACDSNAVYNSSGIMGNDCDWYCDNGKRKEFDNSLGRYVCVS